MDFLMDNMLLIHILLSIIAFGVLSIASLQAILLRVQAKQLKMNRPDKKIKFLLPLQTMQRFLFQLVAIGFILLSISLVSTLFFGPSLKFSAIHISKIVLSLISWVLFGILLYRHYQSGWRGPSAIRWILMSMGLLIVAYAGSKLFFR
jgi:ABC-type uncharacterized transport system permease subunit